MCKHAFDVQRIKFAYACHDLERRLCTLNFTIQPQSEMFFKSFKEIVAMHEIIQFYKRIIDEKPLLSKDELLTNHMSRMATHYCRALYLDNEHLYDLSETRFDDLYGYLDTLTKTENNLRILSGIKVRNFTPIITSRNISWDLLEMFRKHLKSTYSCALSLSRTQFETMGYTQLSYFCNISFNIIDSPLFTVLTTKKAKPLYLHNIKECTV